MAEPKLLEADPNGMKPGEKGAKLDAGKPAVWRGLLDYFPRACLAVADVSSRGAAKYSWKGWEAVKDGETRYGDALARHIIKESIDGPFDVGPGGLGPEVLHASQIAWNALARLELILRRLNVSNKSVPAPSPCIVESSICSTNCSPEAAVCGDRNCQQQHGLDGLDGYLAVNDDPRK